jgi:hypothetical protein
VTHALSILRKVGCLALVVWAGACSSSTAPNSTPTDLSSTGKSRLADYCTKRQTCAVAQNIPAELAKCPTSMCLAGLTEEAALLQYFDCQIAKQCSAFFSDDDCIVAAGTSDAERDAFLARCVAKSDECADDFGDACGIGLPIFRKELMRAVDACLDRACADVQPCVDALPIMDCWK